MMAIAWVGVAICPIWAIIEFILYLVKDRPFNWWSVWTTCICLACGIFLIFYVEHLKRKAVNEAMTPPGPRKSSRLQQKFDEIEAARKEREKLTK